MNLSRSSTPFKTLGVKRSDLFIQRCDQIQSGYVTAQQAL